MSNLLMPLNFRFDGIEPSALNAQIAKKELELRALGLESGDIVAIQMETSVRFVALLFASIRIGAVFCPLNLRLPEQATNAQLATLKPKIFITKGEIKTFAAPKTALLPASFLIFTSGSSGAPKIANLSLQNFLAAAKTAIEICNYQSSDTWLLSLPLFHVGGLSILFRALLANGSVTTDGTNRAITHLSYVPTQLYRAWPLYPHLKTLLLSGAPIHQIPRRLPIIAAYGMTETSSMLLGQKNASPVNGSVYLGFPHPGKEMTLSLEGEILIKGDSLFQGYWDGLKLNKPSEWFATGDLGQFDPQRGFAIVGRKDNQFISGGENIQPEEIEQELLAYPYILEAIVVPKADAEYGFRPVAFIRTAEKIAKENLKVTLLKRLPKYKIPSEFFSLDEIPELGLKPSRKKLFEFATSK